MPPRSRPRVRLEGAALADVLIGLERRLVLLEESNELILAKLSLVELTTELLSRCLPIHCRRKFQRVIRRGMRRVERAELENDHDE